MTPGNQKKITKKKKKIEKKRQIKKRKKKKTCSALKAKYRDELAADDARVKFVHLTGPRTLIAERLKNRRGHFMPPALLESQFAILEPPSDALVFNCEKSPEKIVAELIHVLGIAVPG